MTNVVQVYDYRFPHTNYPIMRFQVRISEIAKSLGFEVESWMTNLVQLVECFSGSPRYEWSRFLSSNT